MSDNYSDKLSCQIKKLKETKSLRQIYETLSDFGMHNYYHGKEVKALDNVLSLDETKHNTHYGVQDIFLYGDGEYNISYLLGNICINHSILSKGRFLEKKRYNTLTKNDKMVTDKMNDGIYSFFIDLLEQRKEQLKMNEYWLLHFNEFCQMCLEISQKFFEGKKEYKVELDYGKSLADNRPAMAIVIYKNNHQYGYIKMMQNKYGDINLDACAIGCCHWERKITNMDKLNDLITYLCDWLS